VCAGAQERVCWLIFASSVSLCHLHRVVRSSGVLWRSSGGPLAVHRYNPASNSWAAMAPLQIARHSMAVATLHGKIYACGGTMDDQSATAIVEVCVAPSHATWCHTTHRKVITVHFRQRTDTFAAFAHVPLRCPCPSTAVLNPINVCFVASRALPHVHCPTCRCQLRSGV
jgi:hypothetical protein